MYSRQVFLKKESRKEKKQEGKKKKNPTTEMAWLHWGPDTLSSKAWPLAKFIC